jgi:hypothetical protein
MVQTYLNCPIETSLLPSMHVLSAYSDPYLHSPSMAMHDLSKLLIIDVSHLQQKQTISANHPRVSTY